MSSKDENENENDNGKTLMTSIEDDETMNQNKKNIIIKKIKWSFR